MHPRFLYDLEHCSIRRALDVLGEKWTLLVLREAIYGIRRFDDFARALGCGRGVLSARLKTLTQEGILERREYTKPDQRPRAEYHLTEKGRDIFPTILALSQWSERWTPPPDGPVSSVTERKSGRPVAVIMTSDPHPRGLKMDDIKIAPGPGAKLLPGVDAKSKNAELAAPSSADQPKISRNRRSGA
jgi:DNA-binding HxlR family transcriptional regulator